MVKSKDLSENPKTWPRRIYIHSPFCRMHCHFCDFYVTTKGAEDPDLLDRFEAAVIQEFYKKFDGVQESLKSLYMGGGTPSLLGSERVSRIIKKIGDHYPLSSEAEVTLEINPFNDSRFDDKDRALSELKSLKSAGVTRLSVGVQSTDDLLLKWLDREHDRSHSLEFLKLADQVGFENLSVDLLYGVPGQSSEQFEKSIEEVTGFKNVNHLSAYCLTLTEGNPHFRSLPEDEKVIEAVTFLEGKLLEKGFQRYEVSNFSKPGFEASHNSSYWKNESFVGLGPGASGYFNGETSATPYGMRTKNLPVIERYLDSILNLGELPACEVEELSKDAAITERLYCGLRSRAGLDLQKFETDFQQDLLKKKRAVINQCLSENLIEIQSFEGRSILRATSSGWNILDEIVKSLMG